MGLFAVAAKSLISAGRLTTFLTLALAGILVKAVVLIVMELTTLPRDFFLPLDRHL